MLPTATLTGNHKQEIKFRCGEWHHRKNQACSICGRKPKERVSEFRNSRLEIRICHGCALLFLFDLMTVLEFAPEYPADVAGASELTQSPRLKTLSKTVYEAYRGMETAMRSRYRKGVRAILRHLRELERQEAALDY